MPFNTCFEIRLENNYTSTDHHQHPPGAKLTAKHKQVKPGGWDLGLLQPEGGNQTKQQRLEVSDTISLDVYNFLKVDSSFLQELF